MRAAIRDEGTTHLRSSAVTDWQIGRLDIDAAARSLAASDRAAAANARRVVVVEVSGPTSSRHVVLRAAIAITVVIAQAVKGFVHDPLLTRLAAPCRASCSCALPFPIPGDAGVESMWIDVTRFDPESLTGRLLDDALGATDVARGQEVTRPRALVEDLRWAR
ncbi:MAG: DUF2314 domain-containing protein [Myxococcales bacterium]|nr:DUF2314 domain-containing protein [Myxococcales bacterium]